MPGRVISYLGQQLLLECFKLVFILDLLLLTKLLGAEGLLLTLVNLVLKVTDLVKLLAILQLHVLVLALGKLEVVLADLELSLGFTE